MLSTSDSQVKKDDIRIRFYEELNNETIWQDYAEFSPADVHEQVAITFKVPPYRNLDIKDPVDVNIQLVRISTEETSQPRRFQYVPRKPVDRSKFNMLSLLAGDQGIDSGIKLVGEFCSLPSTSFCEVAEKRSPKRHRNDSGIADVDPSLTQTLPCKMINLMNNNGNVTDCDLQSLSFALSDNILGCMTSGETTTTDGSFS